MRETWLGYDAVADIYEYDMGKNMPFDDIGYYVRYATQPGGEVLDLGCGIGRVTLALLNEALSVTAVDASSRMLQRLRHARANLTPDLAQRLRVIQMDLRRWDLDSKFATILCSYSLFTYFVEPNEYSSVLDSVRKCLPHGGQFICDAFIPRQLPFGQAIRDYRRRLPDGSILTRSKVIVPEGTEGVYRITRHYERSWGSNIRQGFTTSELIRPWCPDALEVVLKHHSFEILARDLDYGTSLDETSAHFATFRCRLKPG